MGVSSITITFDLEDNRRSPEQKERFAAMTSRFLDFIEQRGVSATVFIVGGLARSHSKLIARVAEGGHEIGLHGLRHVALAEVGRRSLRKELIEGRQMLEEAAQAPVRGFRAPIFSLTRDTEWAVSEIAEAGFTYSSSVLPAANPLYGWPGVPRQPFRWWNKLIEFPCPVGGAGRIVVPFLGGVYMRYIPVWVIRRLVARLHDAARPWTYLHPYDLDSHEDFFVLPHANWLTSRVVHHRRGATLRRLDAVMGLCSVGRPLGDIADELLQREMPIWGPAV